VPPVNLLGDFGGGGMVLALGVVAALLEAGRSGQGQVVDAAMVDGAALLTTQLHELLAAVSRTRTRDDWCRLLEGTDACVAPVLSLLEAPAHPHNQARATFVDVAGTPQPAPAPRFSRTPCATPAPPPAPGDDDQVLAAWGMAPGRVAGLRAAGAIGSPGG
jgi:crotonobetainyl-CoA:carnitine CoA-transferase CaiB-like acyl-CoA transferase